MNEITGARAGSLALAADGLRRTAGPDMSRHCAQERRKARMSRGEHFARPSVHCAINFGHKASPAREIGRSSLDAGFPPSNF